MLLISDNDHTAYKVGVTSGKTNGQVMEVGSKVDANNNCPDLDYSNEGVKALIRVYPGDSGGPAFTIGDSGNAVMITWVSTGIQTLPEYEDDTYITCHPYSSCSDKVRGFYGFKSTGFYHLANSHGISPG